MGTILAFAASCVATVLSATAPNAATWGTLPWKTTDGGKLYYLDRQYMNCNNNALTNFWLRRSGSDNVAYRYSCVRSDAIYGSATSHATAFREIGGSKEVNYMDKHNVECPSGSVMTYFRQGRSGDKINIGYHCRKAHLICCRNKATPENDMGDSVFYLDRHSVGEYKNKEWAIQRWKLDSGYSPKKVIKYSYRVCKLRDMDAAKVVETNRAAVDTEKAALAEAKAKLETSPKAQAKIQAQLTELQSKLQVAVNGAEADEKAVEAQHERIVAATQTLASSEKDPGLTC